MYKLKSVAFVLLVLFLYPYVVQSQIKFDKYHNYAEVQQVLKLINSEHPKSTKIHSIATSPGGREITVIELGNQLDDTPAIFVASNFEGKYPLATEGAMYMIKMLLDSGNYTQNIKWYIMPLPNPDASSAYFARPLEERNVNDMEINNDVDEQTNEDGCEDLNKDGFITKMRIVDPEGTYIVSPKDKRILVKADTKKGERGMYKVFTEGIDNDNDGQYNEDGAGGVNPGITFPHLFKYYDKESGLWSGFTPEVYGVMKFIYDHPEIAMTYTLGNSDFCRNAPEGGRKGNINLDKIKIPNEYAKMFGADPKKTYTMDEVMAYAEKIAPEGFQLSPAMIIGMLGLGMTVNPIDDDVKFYSTLNEEYKKFLKNEGIADERLNAEKAKDGSFELWSYYQLGVPSFSMNLFTVPKIKSAEEKTELTTEKIEAMDVEEFTSIGDEKLDVFLKSIKAPDNIKASEVIENVKTGKITPKQIAEMIKQMPKPGKEGELDEATKSLLAYADKTGNGFVDWTPYEHATLGQVEIGGFKPYLASTPPAGQIDSLCRTQLPWMLQLSKKLPDIKILDSKLTDLGSGIYRLEIFVENSGFFPYPTAMGSRNQQPAPVILVLEGNDFELLEGYKRCPLGDIGGNQVKKLSWMIKSDAGKTITAKLVSAVFSTDVKLINIGG